MKFYLFITGCQYNYYDANKITHLLQKMGYLYTAEASEADLIVVLACSVRQKPMDRIYGKLKLWKQSKKNPKILVVGCVLPKDKNKLEDKVDFVTTIDHINENLIKKLFNKKTLINMSIQPDQMLDFVPLDAKAGTSYIPIMQGCNNFCAYCAVPYTRGREVSRNINEIINEIKSELAKGKKHVILLGQNVNSYQLSAVSRQLSAESLGHSEYNVDSKSKNAFAKLLKQIDKIDGDFDYNFMSSNPWNFSDELIDTLPKLKKWELVLHLPMQSGNDEILKKMNRKYSAKKYLDIITSIKSRVTNLELSTDIIVGFPSETKKQFEDTVVLCKKIGFAKAYVNQYSPRVGTAAAKMKDNVSQAEKKRRWTVLNNLINKKSSK